jgi:hypothetical protein
VDAIEFGQQYDAFLLIWICAGDNRYATFGRAKIIREMRHTRRNVDKISGPSVKIHFESFAVPQARVTAQDIDGGFVAAMLVGLGPSAGRDGHYLQVDSLRTGRLRRDPGRVGKSLLANEFLTGSDDPTGRHVIEMVNSFRFHILCLLKEFRPKRR